MGDFDQYAESAPTSGPEDFSQYAENVSAAASGPSPSGITKTESAGRGFANSASFGLGKWINGILGAAQNQEQRTGTTPPAGSAFTEGAQTTASQSPAQTFGGTDSTGKGFWDDVLGSVEQQKADNAAAFKANPGSYVAGALAPAAITAGAGFAKVATTAGLPTTLAGQVGLGARVGAGTALTESTTKDQAIANATVGAALGAVSTVIGAGTVAGLAKLANSAGASAIKSTLNGLVGKAAAGDQDAIDKLSMAGFGGNGISNRQIVKSATQFSKYLENPIQANEPDFFVGGSEGSQIVKQQVASELAPSTGRILGEGAQAVGQGAAAGYVGSKIGEAIPGIGSLIGGGGGALYGAKGPALAAARDLGTKAAMNFNASPAAQDFAQTLQRGSPLAGGSIVGQSSGPLGLSGILGQYIDQQWRSQ